MSFVNRVTELTALERWANEPHGRLGLVWGRRRTGKTVLLQHFAKQQQTVFLTASGRSQAAELQHLSEITAAAVTSEIRELAKRPFNDWVDALEFLATAATNEPLLLIIDEFPELVKNSPELPTTLRAVWDRVRTKTKLRILLCGSAVRTMEAMQAERAPLYGRIDLRLQLHPFEPHEAALMLPHLTPPDRALVWGLVGGMPLYLEWWDQTADVATNLLHLACTPGGQLLTEGELVLATESESSDLASSVLFAIGRGATKFHEIKNVVHADPTRILDRLVELRLVERILPVTEQHTRTRRKIYRIADNFLAFWLGLLNRFRGEIERGLGETILPVLIKSLDDHLGPRYEEAFRLHLRRLARAGDLGAEIVAIGPFWTTEQNPNEIDAVVLAGRERQAVIVGEAKWTRNVNATDVVKGLSSKAAALPDTAAQLRYAICAREQVENVNEAILPITAHDIFSCERQISIH